jgi:predicted metalloprotease with PDZ domain
MRELYRTTYKKGRGFTAADWWGAVTRSAGGKSFADFVTHYVDGRDPYPWAQILPLAGLRAVADTLREPRLGLAAAQDSAGNIMVMQVQPGSTAAEAGVKVGDVLVALGDIPVTDSTFGQKFRERFGKEEGQTVPIQVRRGGQTLTLSGKLRLVAQFRPRLAIDPSAPSKAVRIREGIFKGTTGP